MGSQNPQKRRPTPPHCICLWLTNWKHIKFHWLPSTTLYENTPVLYQRHQRFPKTYFELPPIPNNAILVTADVVSLYTNIPHEEGINTFMETLSQNKKLLPPETPPLPTIRILLEFLLHNNCFQFLDEYYQQILGTAMGSKCAPPYACIYMGKFETSRLLPLSEAIRLWKRFIDDIFFIFTGSEDELEKLFLKINNLHPTIKFTFEYSKTKINYLDTYIHVGKDRKLYTSLYSKPTDTFALLHFDSYHPLSTKESIIYSQALRYRMIITKDDMLIEALKHLEWVLINRGYPRPLITKNIHKIMGFSQSDILNKTLVPTHNRATPTAPIFSLPHGNLNKSINHILHSHWHLVANDTALSNTFTSAPLLATKRNTNFRDILVSAKTKTESSSSKLSYD